jgi:hypothetical protein
MEAVVIALWLHAADIAPGSALTRIAVFALAQQMPDTSKAKALNRWPNETDMARLSLCDGKPKWVVLMIMGHPKQIWRNPDGTEIWMYRWPAAACVYFRRGVCNGTFYMAGY